MGFWDPERVEALKRLAASGATFSEAAAFLGCSRGAVAGKADRLGLSFAVDVEEKKSRAAAEVWTRPDYRERMSNMVRLREAARRGA